MLYNEFKILTDGLSTDQCVELKNDMEVTADILVVQNQIDVHDTKIQYLNSYIKYGAFSCDALTEATDQFTVSISLKAFSQSGPSLAEINGVLSNTGGITIAANSPVGNASVVLLREYEIDSDVITADYELESGAFVNGDTVTLNFGTLELNGVVLVGSELVVTVGA